MLKLLKYTLLTSFLFFASASQAQVKVLASINKRTISLNESVNFQVTVEGSQKTSMPKFEKLSGFGILQGPSISRQMSFVNGHQSKSVTYSYILKPNAVGGQTIGPVTVKVGSQKYRAKAIQVEVVKGNKNNSNNNPVGTDNIPADKNIFLNLQVDKSEVYVNGQISLALTLYYKDVDITDVTQPDFKLKGFFVYDDGGRPVQQRVMIDNVIYQSVRFQKLLIPLSSGKHKIGPFSLDVTIRVPVRGKRRRDPFDDNFFGGSIFGDFFGNYKTKIVSVKSNPATVNIRKLPLTGKPDDFSGAVGNFSLNVSASPKAVQVGEPVTLTVNLSGKGNIDNASIDMPKDTPGFRIYEPETTRDSRVSGGQLVGKRTYKQAMVPTSTNAVLIPAISFSYFDPEAKKYVSLKKGPFKLTVKPMPEDSKLRITELTSIRNNQGSIRILNQDIFPITTSIDSLGSPKRATSNPVFYTLIIVPPVSWILLAAFARKRHRMLNDTALYRRTNASKKVKARLKKARNALKGDDNKSFYLELSDALTHFVADKVHIPAAQVTAITLPKILTGYKISQDKIAELKNILEYCDFGRFAPGEFSKVEAEERLTASEKLITELEKVIS